MIDDAVAVAAAGGVRSGPTVAGGQPLFDGGEALDDYLLSMLESLDPDAFARLRSDTAAWVGRELQGAHEEIEARAGALLVAVDRDRDDALLSLRSTATQQVASVRRGLDRLGKSERAVQQLATGFAEMDALISTMQSVTSYHQIRQLHFHHENLANVLRWSECFEAFEPGKNRLEEEMKASAPLLASTYAKLRVMQSIRARLAGEELTRDAQQRAALNFVGRHLEEGERIAALFVDYVKTLFEGAAQTCVQFVLDDGAAVAEFEASGGAGLPQGATVDDEARAAAAAREMLFEAVRIANQEARDPMLFDDVAAAGQSMRKALLRMNQNQAAAVTRARAGVGASSSSTAAAAAAALAQLEEEVIEPPTSLLRWEVLAPHVDRGAGQLFINDVLVDPDNKPERKDMPIDDLLSDVDATCTAIEKQLNMFATGIECALEQAPIGSIALLPRLMRALHNEVVNLVETRYCSSTFEVDDQLRCLEFIVQYRTLCLEQGAIGQFVPPAATDAVSTRLLETAVSGMKRHLGGVANGCALRVTDKEMLQHPRERTLSTTGPQDLLEIMTSMLKNVTKKASSEVRTKMSNACALALRHYVDRFCDLIAYGDNFTKWYSKIADKSTIFPPGTPLDTRWVMWQCAAINDFTKLQSHVGTMETFLFDMQHAAGSAAPHDATAAGGGGPAAAGGAAGAAAASASGAGAVAAARSAMSPLQSFASVLGKEVVLKLISFIADYWEIRVFAKEIDQTCDVKAFLPSAKSGVAELADEVAKCCVEVGSALQTPWNAVVARSLAVRMLQIYVQRLLQAICSGSFDARTTRAVLSARLTEDLRQWGRALGELPEPNVEALRFEDRTAETVPDLPGAVAALRVILALAQADSVPPFQRALRDDLGSFHDIPEWLFDVMFVSNKAASDIKAADKSRMKELWKEHIEWQAAAAARSANMQFLTVDEGGSGGGGGGAAAAAQPLVRHTSIFSGLVKDRIVPRRSGVAGFLFGGAVDKPPDKIGYRFDPVKICSEKIQLREAVAPRPARQEETVTMEEFLRRHKQAMAAQAASPAAAPAAAA
jgi:hypothetical protein